MLLIAFGRDHPIVRPLLSDRNHSPPAYGSGSSSVAGPSVAHYQSCIRQVATKGTLSSQGWLQGGCTPPAPAIGEGVLVSPADMLTRYERHGNTHFDEVYFRGRFNDMVTSTRTCADDNNRFDDERGDYRVVMGEHIAYRYEVVGMLGRGSFGQVVKAFDHKMNCPVAIKIIRNRARFHKQEKTPLPGRALTGELACSVVWDRCRHTREHRRVAEHRAMGSPGCELVVTTPLRA
jgi:hypothetical protein